MRKQQVFIFLFLFFFPFIAYSASARKEGSETTLLHLIHEDICRSVEQVETMPGFDAETFSSLKEGILSTWNILFSQGVVEVHGSDEEIRPYFVSLQGMIENALANGLNKEIASLKGLIHTPMPATSLCTQGKVSEELVDPSIVKDPMRLGTVKARTTILRDYLFKGGKLFIVYPQQGLLRRTKEQRTIYRQELRNNYGHLFNMPLKCKHIPSSLIGATYLFKDRQGKTFVFSIKMTQANDPKDEGDFALWFGPLNDPAIHKRVRTLIEFMEKNGAQITKVL